MYLYACEYVAIYATCVRIIMCIYELTYVTYLYG